MFLRATVFSTPLHYFPRRYSVFCVTCVLRKTLGTVLALCCSDFLGATVPDVQDGAGRSEPCWIPGEYGARRKQITKLLRSLSRQFVLNKINS